MISASGVSATIRDWFMVSHSCIGNGANDLSNSHWFQLGGMHFRLTHTRDRRGHNDLVISIWYAVWSEFMLMMRAHTGIRYQISWYLHFSLIFNFRVFRAVIDWLTDYHYCLVQKLIVCVKFKSEWRREPTIAYTFMADTIWPAACGFIVDIYLYFEWIMVVTGEHTRIRLPTQ